MLAPAVKMPPLCGPAVKDSPLSVKLPTKTFVVSKAEPVRVGLVTVTELAQTAFMSERTLIRRFQETTGMSPGAWLTQQRLDFARGLLESKGTSIEDVARLSGFGNSATLRLHFRRRLGISPTDYRRQFRAVSGQMTSKIAAL